MINCKYRASSRDRRPRELRSFLDFDLESTRLPSTFTLPRANFLAMCMNIQPRSDIYFFFPVVNLLRFQRFLLWITSPSHLYSACLLSILNRSQKWRSRRKKSSKMRGVAQNNFNNYEKKKKNIGIFSTNTNLDLRSEVAETVSGRTPTDNYGGGR